ncbi:UPF0389 protein CG9231-like [Penaeus chinensis]|uniref:UPF0389 protein CG9231-like n=1 Tax=Penaeus chinensis TaxID=139456 RepID=UPI001FB5A9CD|nr:UPF0389 protein CG9231-like [Penaeus chinensis]
MALRLSSQVGLLLRTSRTSFGTSTSRVLRAAPAGLRAFAAGGGEGGGGGLAKTEGSSSAAPPPAPASAPKGNIGLRDHRINRFEKFLMVWGGKYKSMDEVPEYISQDSLERARNKARIKINMLMGLATLIGCFVMIWSGKRAQREGQTVVKMNEEWHRKMKEEASKAKGSAEGDKAS